MESWNSRFLRPAARARATATGLLAIAIFALSMCSGGMLGASAFPALKFPAGQLFGQTALAATGGGSWTWPVDGDVLTPFRNGDDPYAAGQHRGIDIAAAAGTSVRAATSGEISYAGRLPDSGVCVTVRSAGGGHLVSYLHLSSLAVKRGDSVAAGAIVGRSGVTGSRSVAAPHLHLSVRVTATGAYVDPLPLLGPRGGRPTGVQDRGGALTPLSAAPPSAAEIEARNGSRHARGEDLPDTRDRTVPRDRARSRAHSRSRANSDKQSRDRRNRRPSGNRRSDVHAQSPGDSVAGARPETAGDSARESHASRGRVAPPPSNPSRTTLTTGSPNGKNSDSYKLLSSRPDSASRSAGHSSRLAPMIAATALLALAVFLLRRRLNAGDTPTDGEPELVISRVEPSATDMEHQARPHLHAVER